MKSDNIFLVIVVVIFSSFFVWLWYENARQTREMDVTFAKMERRIQIDNANFAKAQYQFSIVPKLIYNKQHCPKKPIEGSDRRRVGKHWRHSPLEYSTEEFRIFAAIVGTNDSIRFNVSEVVFDKLQIGNKIDTINGYHFILQ